MEIIINQRTNYEIAIGSDIFVDELSKQLENKKYLLRNKRQNNHKRQTLSLTNQPALSSV